MVAFTTALGNDTRAMEAAAHFFASSSGTYLPLSKWTLRDEQLKGVFRVPTALGSVGGSIKASRISRLCYKILGVDSGVMVREICTAVGLAANLGVLRALVTTGIGKSHHQRK
jgi:hydroxymethylglutaryl-CoA reductase